MVGQSSSAESPIEIIVASTRLGRIDTERSLEGDPQVPIKAESGRLTCFGRVVVDTKRISDEESKISGSGLSYRKSKHCLKKLSCISSCDVLPCVSSRDPASGDRRGATHCIEHRRESLSGVKRSKVALTRSIVHRNLPRGLGGFLRERGTVDVRPLSSRPRKNSGSSFRTGSCCLIRPRAVQSESMVSSTAMSRANSVMEDGGRGRGDPEVSRASMDSCGTSVLSLFNDEALSQRLVGSENGNCFYDRDLDVSERRNRNGGLWSNSGLSNGIASSLSSRDHSVPGSGVFSGPSSGRRPTRVPFLFGMAHRTRSLEFLSSPASYMRSPEVHWSNPDLLRSFPSTLQSPYLSRVASSPGYRGSYRVHGSSETPVFRSFRQFPLQPFEEGQECFTFGGLSEEQFLMWEANLLLGGTASHDQFRDLRLDIDSMSYEDLLALEESMGNVPTGLAKETIASCLRSKVFSGDRNLTPSEEVNEFKCSICQVDFEEAAELGILKCGHSHHYQCIEEWLSQKNQCPICKATAFTKVEA